MVLAAVSIKCVNFEDVSLCTLVDKFQSLGGSSFPHLQGKGVATLKMRAVDFSVMLVPMCQTA